MVLKIHPNFRVHLLDVLLQRLGLQERDQGVPHPLVILTAELRQVPLPQDQPHRLCLLVHQGAAVSCEHELVRCRPMDQDRRLPEQAQLRDESVLMNSGLDPLLRCVGPLGTEELETLTENGYPQ